MKFSGTSMAGIINDHQPSRTVTPVNETCNNCVDVSIGIGQFESFVLDRVIEVFFEYFNETLDLVMHVEIAFLPIENENGNMSIQRFSAVISLIHDVVPCYLQL